MAPDVGAMQLAECAGVGQAELAEEDAGSREGGGEHVVDHAAGPGHGALAVVEAQHQEREGELQAEAPGDGAPANVLRSVEPSQAAQQHGKNSQNSGESIQSVRSLKKQGSGIRGQGSET